LSSASAHGEEQALRRRPAHHPEVPGALQATLLHPPRQVWAPAPPRRHVPVRHAVLLLIGLCTRGFVVSLARLIPDAGVSYAE
jgi:hypothetical protein